MTEIGATQASQEDHYRELLIAPIRQCASYLPKMGGGDEVDFDTFEGLYGDDPFYHWVGLDTAPMYAAHKAAGGMTSVYRQLGIGSERLLREILKDQLGLTQEQVVWSYEQVVASPTGGEEKKKTLTLDGRIDLADVKNEGRREKVQEWIQKQATSLDITIPLKGVVFEVRQGYKSADSKRQNADILNASQSLGHGYLPALAIMSTQINKTVYERYIVNNWAVLRGHLSDDPMSSTIAFVEQILDFDFRGFFQRNTDAMRSEVVTILNGLLEAK